MIYEKCFIRHYSLYSIIYKDYFNISYFIWINIWNVDTRYSASMNTYVIYNFLNKSLMLTKDELI